MHLKQGNTRTSKMSEPGSVGFHMRTKRARAQQALACNACMTACEAPTRKRAGTQCTSYAAGEKAIASRARRSRRQYAPNVLALHRACRSRRSPSTSREERERERLHLSSPEADAGAARTSPGRSQRRNSVINTKKDKPMSQQRREQSPRQGSNDSHRSPASTSKQETKGDQEASMCSKDVS